MCCIALHCIVLYCIVLYCIVLYCIVSYHIVSYCIVLYCIVHLPIYCGTRYQAALDGFLVTKSDWCGSPLCPKQALRRTKYHRLNSIYHLLNQFWIFVIFDGDCWHSQGAQMSNFFGSPLKERSGDITTTMLEPCGLFCRTSTTTGRQWKIIDFP